MRLCRQYSFGFFLSSPREHFGDSPTRPKEYIPPSGHFGMPLEPKDGRISSHVGLSCDALLYSTAHCIFALRIWSKFFSQGITADVERALINAGRSPTKLMSNNPMTTMIEIRAFVFIWNGDFLNGQCSKLPECSGV
jgi:hypothetical protein